MYDTQSAGNTPFTFNETEERLFNMCSSMRLQTVLLCLDHQRTVLTHTQSEDSALHSRSKVLDINKKSRQVFMHCFHLSNYFLSALERVFGHKVKYMNWQKQERFYNLKHSPKNWMAKQHASLSRVHWMMIFSCVQTPFHMMRDRPEGVSQSSGLELTY